MTVPGTIFPEQEIREAHDRYIKARDRVEAGGHPWSVLADFFTDDATFVDPAWGRIDGIAAIRAFFDDKLKGLEGWTFPREFTAVDGNRVISGWQNRLPGARPDGTLYQTLGVSIMTYAGNGRFCREEGILNMAHVLQLIQESGWKPGSGYQTPPHEPRR